MVWGSSTEQSSMQLGFGALKLLGEFLLPFLGYKQRQTCPNLGEGQLSRLDQAQVQGSQQGALVRLGPLYIPTCWKEYCSSMQHISI